MKTGTNKKDELREAKTTLRQYGYSILFERNKGYYIYRKGNNPLPVNKQEVITFAKHVKQFNTRPFSKSDFKFV